MPSTQYGAGVIYCGIAYSSTCRIRLSKLGAFSEHALSVGRVIVQIVESQKRFLNSIHHTSHTVNRHLTGTRSSGTQHNPSLYISAAKTLSLGM